MSCRERRCCRGMRRYKKAPRIEIKLASHVDDPGIWGLGIMTSRPSSMLFQERTRRQSRRGRLESRPWHTRIPSLGMCGRTVCQGPGATLAFGPCAASLAVPLSLPESGVDTLLHSVGSEECAPSAEAPSQCGLQLLASHRRRKILARFDRDTITTEARQGTSAARKHEIANARDWKRKDKNSSRVQYGP
jgi:hypothetical protein